MGFRTWYNMQYYCSDFDEKSVYAIKYTIICITFSHNPVYEQTV